MKVVRIYLMVALVSFLLGIAVVVITPPAAQAVPVDCYCNCGRFYVDCGLECPKQWGGTGSWYGLGYPYKNDIGCEGPYFCEPVIYGCHYCQP